MTSHPLASEVARMFFEDQLTKIEVATRLGISRFRVARLIDRALDTGLVRIEYSPHIIVDQDLGRRLEKRFGLRLSVVARRTDADTEDGMAQLGVVGASVVADLIGPTESVGIAWGSSAAALVSRLPFRDTPTFAAIVAAATNGDLLCTHLVDRFTRHLGAMLVSGVHAFSPAAVVLAGGVALAAETLVGRVQGYVDAHAWRYPRDRVIPVLVGSLGEYSGAAGAAWDVAHGAA